MNVPLPKMVKDAMLDVKEGEAMLLRKPPDDIETLKPTREIKSSLTIEGLDQIKKPHTDLVIWHRTLPSRFQNWLECLPASNLLKVRILVEPGDLRSALDPMLDACGLPISDIRNFMVSDIRKLIED